MQGIQVRGHMQSLILSARLFGAKMVFNKEALFLYGALDKQCPQYLSVEVLAFWAT